MAAHCTDSDSEFPRGNVHFYDCMADCYDLFFRDPEGDSEAEGDWIAGVLHPHQAHSVLDACCGAGRQAIPLAARGFVVVAGDPSRGMLGRAQTKARNKGVEVRFVEVSSLRLAQRLIRRFDAVLAMGNGLCNLTSLAAIVAALQGLRACCRDGGLCLIGIKDFDIIQPNSTVLRRRTDDDDGHRRAPFEIWDVHEPLLRCAAVLVSEGAGPYRPTVRTYTTREYMLGGEELLSAARTAGFAQIERLDHRSEAVSLLRA